MRQRLITLVGVIALIFGVIGFAAVAPPAQNALAHCTSPYGSCITEWHDDVVGWEDCYYGQWRQAIYDVQTVYALRDDGFNRRYMWDHQHAWFQYYRYPYPGWYC